MSFPFSIWSGRGQNFDARGTDCCRQTSPYRSDDAILCKRRSVLGLLGLTEQLTIQVLYITSMPMTPSDKKQTAFRIDPDILEGLQEIKRQVGIPLSEQVRRALRAWLEQQGVRDKAERPRAVTRKGS